MCVNGFYVLIADLKIGVRFLHISPGNTKGYCKNVVFFYLFYKISIYNIINELSLQNFYL